MFGRKKRTGFGRLVIGDRRAKEEVEEKKDKASKYGPLIRGSKKSPAGTAQRAHGSRPIGAGALSVNQLRQLLKDNPTYVTVYYDREATRRPYPRLPALQILLDVATKQKDELLVAKITGAIVSVKRILKDEKQKEVDEARTELEAKARAKAATDADREAARLARIERNAQEREDARLQAAEERRLETEAARQTVEREREKGLAALTPGGSKPRAGEDDDVDDLKDLARREDQRDDDDQE